MVWLQLWFDMLICKQRQLTVEYDQHNCDILLWVQLGKSKPVRKRLAGTTQKRWTTIKFYQRIPRGQLLLKLRWISTSCEAKRTHCFMMTSSNEKKIPHYWPFVRGIHLSAVAGEFPAQRSVTRSSDVFFDLCLNKWGRVNSRKADDLRHHRAHYDVTAMLCDSIELDNCDIVISQYWVMVNQWDLVMYISVLDWTC